ncbi:type III secretion system outer membrane ring subunit SctC [Chitinimonas koreensis]|uniref:type III secretion system outer membrane ring subunit SctC n=1 Tax=Chitinimonas koreensis TaxID=356302 RepID=UPI000412ECF8|nr:type III secretion system outer membrane ring subunit SctC [Chitinimonas koreensis]
MPFPRSFPRLIAVLPAAVALALAPPAEAAVPDTLKDGSYAYQAANAPLARVLGDFADNYGLTLSLSPRLGNLTVKGRQHAASGVDFLDRLALQYKLQWFIYGGRLYVSPLDDFASERVEVSAEAALALKQALAGMGVLESKFGWGELPDDGAVLISGPKEYVKVIRQLVTGSEKPGTGDALVFRLKYASVEDREISYRDRRIVTPGVATLLRTIVGERGETADKAGSPPTGLAFGQADMAQGAQQARQRLGSAPRASRIAADVRLNAVVIRDSPGRREFYRRLIEELDAPQRLVEIEAMIVDIDRDKLTDIGAEFTLAGRHGRYELGDAGRADTVLGSTTLLLNNFDRFYVRLRALEENGEAKVLARPAIMTMDNMSAVLDLSKTTYLKVVGERVADAKEITAGTMLRVTPRLIGEGEDVQVQLVIDIEDGDIQDPDAKRDVPTVQRSTVSTQAIVDDNQSLVIGGYNVERFNRNNRKVPILGDIPLLGRLFQSDQSGNTRRERLFIITPRTIDATQPGALAARAMEVAIPLGKGKGKK